MSQIHINQHQIKANLKDGGQRPVITVKDKGENRYAREVKIDGPSTVRYDGTRLDCGARCWIETDSPLTLVDEMTFTEAKFAMFAS